MKFSAHLCDWLAEEGYTHCFLVAGGGSMHLLDAARTRVVCVPVVHEQAAGIAVEHFNECSDGARAFALVTTGPGLTNIITPIAACYAERRELLVIAGQVNTRDRCPGLRQSGIQEVDGVALCKSITVRSECLTAPISKREFLGLIEQDAHPGPVLIEVCLEVQAQAVEEQPGPIAAILAAIRPVIVLGGLVSRKTADDCLTALEALGVPVLTTTSAIDRVPSASPVHFGRAGTWGGQRSANLILAQADVVIAIGAQLDIQQTGFNWGGYVNGTLFQVFPDDHELAKGRLKAIGINENPNYFLPAFLRDAKWADSGWLEYASEIRRIRPEPNVTRRGYLCPYMTMRNISLASRADDVIALSSAGGTFTGGMNCVSVALGQRVTVSPAFASMGWGLSTAIGSAFATGKRIILFEGDGGFAQNLQELATVRKHNLPIKIFLFDNGGYASIRATQNKYFGGVSVGCDEKTGLGSPSWISLFESYGITASVLFSTDTERLANLMESDGPEAFIVRVDPEQTNYPTVASSMGPDGKMRADPNWSMVPALSAEEFERVSKYLPRESSL